VYSKADEDNIFFMAGAISFNVLVAFLPLVLFLLGIAGYVVSQRFADPGAAILGWLSEVIPDTGEGSSVSTQVTDALNSLVSERGGLSLAGGIFLVWISTRLVGTLRTVLREVFDVAQDRGMVRGKIFDAGAVVVGGVLIILNVGATVFFKWVGEYGLDLLSLDPESLHISQLLVARAVAFVSTWILFLLIYRMLPARRIPWRTCLVAATFTGVLFEAFKSAFSWYVVSVANYGSVYGNLATLVILFLWIYYSAVVFILGGEVAQVYTMRRVRKQSTKTAAQAVGPATTVMVAVLGASVLAAPAAGQALDPPSEVVYSSRSISRDVQLDLPLLDHMGRYIVVHLAQNRVFVVEDGEAIFSAPAGTGNGFRLAGGGKRWKFTTPQGLFKLRRKEKDPLWEAPDWYYVEKGIPIPPDNHPSRMMRGIMGTTALYLGDGIAIHGTNQPELLLNPDPEARRVSHGCIRLTNEAARTLYHLVDVGTPVLIF
jgi:membrane protein